MLLLTAPPPFGSGSPWIRPLAGLLLLAALVSCSSSGISTDEGAGEPSGPITPPAANETIAFNDTTPLKLSPGEVASLTVRVSPPLKQTVRFEILTERADFDGFLLQAETQVRDDGSASVELQAPSLPATFMVRASLSADLQALRAISISYQGYGEFSVRPRYNGERKIDQWTASARAGLTCEELASLWEDGPLVATGSSSATITSVPSGPPIAVTMRGGQLVSGCSTITGLAPNEQKEVTIDVSDRPPDVTKGALSLRLGVDSTTTAFAKNLEAAITSATFAFSGNAPTEGAALLEAMSTHLSGDDVTDFLAAVDAHELAAGVDQTYKQRTPITSSILATLTEAAGAISGEDVFMGELSLQTGTSQFLLTHAAGVPAAVSGFFQGSNWMASVDSGDTVVLGGSLTYEPVRWLVAIAEHNASEESPPPSVTAAAGNCAAVADALTAAASGPTHDDCEETCLEELCVLTLKNVWQDLRLAGNGLTTLQIGISGHALLYGAAQVASIDVSWIGRLVQEETSLKGPAYAEAIQSTAR